jgi:hypothetical protein
VLAFSDDKFCHRCGGARRLILAAGTSGGGRRERACRLIANHLF